MTTIRVGTRGSLLALTQTGHVVDALRAHNPGVEFETVVIRTTGDARTDVTFAAVGTKGMFVKELEEALMAGSVDLAIHSMKDMPGELADGLVIGATPKRVDARDALISREGTLRQLPPGAVVGTSSLRRQAQIRAARPDLQLEELRGNLDTRLRKLDEGLYDAIILACAGLERMGFANRITERLSIEVSTPAPGQGALALELRNGDASVAQVLAPLNDSDTAGAIRAERAFQSALGAGCTVPAGAHALVDGDQLRLMAMIAAPDGSEVLRAERIGSRSDAGALGKDAAEELLAKGGRKYV